MWSAVVLVCNIAVTPIFEQNEVVTTNILPSSACYISIAPKWAANEAECMYSVDKVTRDPNFTIEGYQIFSFKCFKWKNYNYKGEPT